MAKQLKSDELTRKVVSEAVNHILDMHEAQEMVDLAICMYEAELEEMTTTSATPGYLTPKAFQGQGPEGKSLMVRRSVNSTGWMHTDDGLESVEDGADKLHRDEVTGWLDEASKQYHALKNDQHRTAKTKIGDEVRAVKRALRGIHKSLRVLKKYKTEVGYSGESFWKRTQEDIYAMDELLLRISDSLREMRT